MDVQLLPPDSPQWRDCLQQTAHDVYHLPEYIHLEAAREGGRALGFYTEDEHGWMLVPLIVRRIDKFAKNAERLSDVTGPYGFASPLFRHRCGSHEDLVPRALQEMCQVLGERRIVSAFLRMHPLRPIPATSLTKVGYVVDHGKSVYVDLRHSYDELWRNTRPRYRSYINSLQREGYLASMDESWASLDRFVEMYRQTMLRVRAAEWYHFSSEYFRILQDKLRGKLHLCTVACRDSIVCGGIFSEYAGTVHYLYGGVDSAHLNSHASKLLIDHVRRWAKERGNRLLHLGGGVGGRNDSLFQFKSGFSRTTTSFSTLRIVTHPFLYQHLVRRWEEAAGVRADAPNQFFPAYRKPTTPAAHSRPAGHAA
jgi:hypothetical protein